MRRTDINKKWLCYEAKIQDAIFEWPCPIPERPAEAEEKCREFLDKVFTEYRLEKFYLTKGVDP